MAVTTIYLHNEKYSKDFLFEGGGISLARRLLMNDMYRFGGRIIVDLEGDKAAEEIFDITNNPERTEEREDVYGRGRSVTIGDIVAVDGVNYLCKHSGWEVVE